MRPVQCQFCNQMIPVGQLEVTIRLMENKEHEQYNAYIINTAVNGLEKLLIS